MSAARGRFEMRWPRNCFKAPIAQLAEQGPLKSKVPGSTPGGRTTINLYLSPLKADSPRAEIFNFQFFNYAFTGMEMANAFG